METHWQIFWPNDNINRFNGSLYKTLNPEYCGAIIKAVREDDNTSELFFADPETGEISWADLGKFAGASRCKIYPFNQWPDPVGCYDPAVAISQVSISADASAMVDGLTQAAKVADELQFTVDLMAHIQHNSDTQLTRAQYPAEPGDLTAFNIEGAWFIGLITAVNKHGYVTEFESIPAGRSFPVQPSEWAIILQSHVYRERIIAAYVNLHPIKRKFKSAAECADFMRPYLRPDRPKPEPEKPVTFRDGTEWPK